ncbi:hypothetical protein LTR37_012979 [Vermiconidia calcicola]|uniref:Uncharacterized protein n=1 Tax=Vermiconidia calcicola TaxID=1690605 RepID=A0ACC3MZ69_9PEZI|nr:hypothetical protein LTR37_012979 [Vermiconidia calcicola]
MAPQLLELDSVEIQVIIDNELDPISPSPNPSVTQTGGMRTIGMNGPDISTDSKRAGAVKELRMDHICCSVHGLSLLITGHRRDQSHTILFDTGPEESAWERNAKRLKADVGSIERVVLSHWHRDHSGGMLKVLSMINEARSTNTTSLPQEPVHVDLHPSRPEYRGMQPPDLPVVSLEADPTFAEIGSTGAVVDRRSDAHTVLSDFFLVSGEIPRVTEYEKGLKFGMRLDEGKDKWEQDEEVADERFLMCKIKDKGILTFTGCSHAGVVNAAKHSLELADSAPLYAIMGGFHLADAEPEQIEATAADLKALDVKVLLAGHCTGWRAKFELERVFGRGSLVPSFVGSRFVL